MRNCFLYAPWMGLMLGLAGCHHPSVTAVSLDADACGPECCSFWGVLHHCVNQKEDGIPFYLPKPLLIVAKNFRNIEEAKVGLTDSAPIPTYFDDQAKYADLNARTNFVMPDGGVAQPSNGVAATSPASTFPNTNLAFSSGPRVFQGGAPISPYGRVTNDHLTPETFYTYHIVFVPDMTHKYGLKIKGGVGEIRAAMNLVNGWQFTGLGPYYMKDSSTAQDTLASGITANLAASGVANVIKSIASLPKTGVAAPAAAMAPPAAPTEELPAGATESLQFLSQLDLKPVTLYNYAEISVYEAYVSPEGTMEWRPLTGLDRMAFNRDVLGAVTRTTPPKPPVTTLPPPGTETACHVQWGSVNDVKDIPQEARSLIVLATVKPDNLLHFRIFDSRGKIVVDKDENDKSLADKVQEIAVLKKQIESFASRDRLTDSENNDLVNKVKSIVGRACEALGPAPFPAPPAPLPAPPAPLPAIAPATGASASNSTLVVPPPLSTPAEAELEKAVLNRTLGVPASGAVGTGITPVPAPGSIPVGVAPVQIDLNKPLRSSRLGLPRLSNVLHHKKTQPLEATQVVTAPTVVPVAPVPATGNP